MSWIKEANKIGRYETTYKGFRFYYTKEASMFHSIVEKDGALWNKTEIIKAELVAINKNGLTLEGNYIDEMAFRIDIILIKKSYDNNKKS